MKLVCQICGSKKTANDKAVICQHLCYWQLEGWLGWNGKKQLVVIRDRRAVQFVSRRFSYPKMLATARAWGWRGEPDAQTMVDQEQTS